MGGLLAVERTTIAPGMGLAALALTTAALVALAVLWRSSRPRPVATGGATMELGDERPAVVALLTGGFTVDEAAVPATVVDLAHRGHLAIDKLGGRTVLRLRNHRRDARPLTAYEQRVLDHIRRGAIDGAAPVEVLTLGEVRSAQRWLRSFAREVAADARAQGLCTRRWGPRRLATLWGLVIMAFAGPAVVWATAPTTTFEPPPPDTASDGSPLPTNWNAPLGDPVGPISATVAIVAALGGALVARRITDGDAQVDTPQGRTAASRWLGVREHLATMGDFRDKEAAAVAIWDDHLAYATAMGLAPQVERELPFAPESDTRAWSKATGRWRMVRVSYRSLLPFAGGHPAQVLFSGLVQGAFVTLVAYLAFQIATDHPSAITGELDLDPDRRNGLAFAAAVVTAVVGVVVLYCGAKVAIGAADLFRRRPVAGIVVRRRSYAQGIDKHTERIEARLRLPFAINLGSSAQTAGDRRSQRNRFVAIDDGTSDRITALRVDQQAYARCPQGATVQAKVSPILGYVAEVTVIAPPEEPEAPAVDVFDGPGLAHDIVDRFARAAGIDPKDLPRRPR